MLRLSLLRQRMSRWEPRRLPEGKCLVTVGLAAICMIEKYWGVICASDRMITSGDIEFEPPSAKIYQLTDSIVMLIAGDAEPQGEILHSVGQSIRERLEEDQSWMLVREMADIVSRHIIGLVQQRQERVILQPFRLDLNSFLERQREMRPEFFKKLTDDLETCRPNIQTLVAGVDPSGAHIYELDPWGNFESRDTAGFAAIGAGRRHAESHFMFAKHAGHKRFPETLLLTYTAKRRAETAPGVGRDTDMCVIYGTGGFIIVQPLRMDLLRRLYERLMRRSEKAIAQANESIAKDFEKLKEFHYANLKTPQGADSASSSPVPSLEDDRD